MNNENTKILIALVLKSENGVFLKRRSDGLFGLPSKFLEKDEQPAEITQQLVQEFDIKENDISGAKHDSKNVPADDKYPNNIVVILTTYNLVGNNLSDKRLIEVNDKNLVRTHLDRIAECVLKSDLTDENVMNIVLDDKAINDVNRMNKNDKENNKNEHKSLCVFSDGGSRGNPGPSACGFVIEDENGVEVYRGGEYLGVTTNNQAEYHGVRLALEKALELGANNVDFKGDSLLVINQMKGIYRVKNKDLWPIYERIKELVAKFDEVTFTHVYREHNRGADAMVNKILDQHISSSN